MLTSLAIIHKNGSSSLLLNQKYQLNKETYQLTYTIDKDGNGKFLWFYLLSIQHNTKTDNFTHNIMAAFFILILMLSEFNQRLYSFNCFIGSNISKNPHDLKPTYMYFYS